MAQAIHETSPLTAAHRPAVWFARPKPLAIGCLVLLAGLGWVYLSLMLAGVGSAVPQSPGTIGLVLAAIGIGLIAGGVVAH